MREPAASWRGFYNHQFFYYQTVFEKTLKVILLFRLLSKIKRFARVTLAGRSIKPDDAEEVVEAEGEEQGVQGEGDEIIIVVEKEEESKEAPGVEVALKEVESTSESPSTTSSTSSAWGSRRLVGRGGWRQIGRPRAPWRGHLEEKEEEEQEEGEDERSRSSEARGRSLELEDLKLEKEEEEVEEQGTVALGRAEGRVALRLEKDLVTRREGRMVVERSSGVDLLKFTNFLIVTVGVAVFIILSSGKNEFSLT